MTRGTVLTYHAVGECAPENDTHQLFVSTESFREQMRFLARHRSVVPVEDFIVGRTTRRSVAITFDDAYRNLLTNALPELEAYGFPAMVFAPTAWLGLRNGWLEPSSCDFDIMNEAELREADKRGLRIESHGHRHIDFATATHEEAAADLAASAAILEKVLGRSPRFFAYPFGYTSPAAEETARRAGLTAAFTIDTPHRGTFAFGRVPVTPYDGALVFRAKTSGLWLSLRRSRAGEIARRTLAPLVRRG